MPQATGLTETREALVKTESKYQRLLRKSKEGAEVAVEIGLPLLAAGGVAWWLTGEEERQWAGIDKEAWIAGAGALLALWGKGGKQASMLGKNLAIGVGSWYVGNYAAAKKAESP